MDSSATRKAANAEPSDGLINSQSVNGANTVGRDSRDYDTGALIHKSIIEKSRMI